MGSIGYYEKLLNANEIEFANAETFVKQTPRNRFTIAGANGVQNLTIHVEKAEAGTTIKDIRISHAEKWQTNMLRTLKTCYGNAPFFEFYDYKLFPELEKKHTFLWDWSLELFDISIQLLKSDAKFTEYNLPIKDLDANFISNDSPSEAANTYRQVFTERNGFVANLSIIDLIFNSGPNALDFLIRHES